MQESLLFTFTSALSQYHEDGNIPQPQGNGPQRESGPYNVYATRDGYIAIICVTDDHWRRLAAEMGRPELADDPRFARHSARVKNVVELDALVGEWAAGCTREQAHQALRRSRIPGAPIRDLAEILEDPHMHERGALERIEHRDWGPMVLPRSPLRFTDREPAAASVEPPLRRAQPRDLPRVARALGRPDRFTRSGRRNLSAATGTPT